MVYLIIGFAENVVMKIIEEKVETEFLLLKDLSDNRLIIVTSQVSLIQR